MQKTKMTEFLAYIEWAIDQLVFALPLGIFDQLPALARLLADDQGRYIFGGIVLVLLLMLLWIVMWLGQRLLVGKPKAAVADKVTDAVATRRQAGAMASASVDDGSRFHFLRRADQSSISDDTAALMAIEQEMLAVRQLFADGHILQDVYIAETRRLYRKAKVLQNSLA